MQLKVFRQLNVQWLCCFFELLVCPKIEFLVVWTSLQRPLATHSQSIIRIARSRMGNAVEGLQNYSVEMDVESSAHSDKIVRNRCLSSDRIIGRRKDFISQINIQLTIEETRIFNPNSRQKASCQWKNLQKWLAFAQEYRDWTPSDYPKILFTYESLFERYAQKSRIAFRQRVGERYSLKYRVGTVKH